MHGGATPATMAGTVVPPDPDTMTTMSSPDEHAGWPVAVVVDSSSGVSRGLARQWGLTTVPLTVSLGDDSFDDLVDTDNDDFYRALRDASGRLSTAAPPPAAWSRCCARAFEAGHEHVVIIGVSSSISGVVAHAATAAKEFDDHRITIMDSGQAGGAQALVAMAAAAAARGGSEADEVVAAATRAATQVHLWMALPNLDALRRSGRVGTGPSGSDNGPVGAGPPPGSGAGPMLITLRDGTIQPVGPTPPGTDAADALAARVAAVASQNGLRHILVSHSDNRDVAVSMAARLRQDCPDVAVDVTPLSAVVGGHCGPGTIGVAVRTAR